MKINVTVKTIEHPNPKQAIDSFAHIVLKEILKQEEAQKIGGEAFETTVSNHNSCSVDFGLLGT